MTWTGKETEVVGHKGRKFPLEKMPSEKGGGGGKDEEEKNLFLLGETFSVP